jgi:uncharacterized membrane protein
VKARGKTSYFAKNIVWILVVLCVGLCFLCAILAVLAYNMANLSKDQNAFEMSYWIRNQKGEIDMFNRSNPMIEE